MSRLLVVADDTRKKPTVVCWWRHELQEQAGTGYISITRLAVDGGTDWKDPWAGSIEYFDGRDDWIFPYAHRVTPKKSVIDRYPVKLDIVEIVKERYFLDILDVAWPGHGWFRLGKNGIHHPDDYKESTYDWR
ncbi:hypothetical protein [Mycobacteroides abscessus]|uniref:hypothetical protein n=1 Tax=Mycobacteroides abscessus TaxID=36809 RepID=UPI0009431012|nr:hypothetical protein [Mycobacteroides abscessus]